MDNKKVTRIALITLFGATLLLALIPVLQTALKGEYRGVPPAYVDDDLYYYGRMREVADQHPLLGNPYFIEHRDAGSVAFSITDWLAAVPLFVGIPFTLAVIGNFIFWSLVFVFLTYLVVRVCDLSPPYAAVVALFAYCEVYWVVFRPVIMQQVFPFFLFFLLALLMWFREPLQRRSLYLLTVASALSFYVYSFLWQIIFVVLGIIFLYRVLQKRWHEVRSLLWVALGTTILSLPMLLLTMRQLRDPLYWETFARIGLLKSYLPTIDAYRYGRWAVLLTVLYFLVHAWANRSHGDVSVKNRVVTPVAIYMGIGLIVASLSNILTGKDVATGQHVGRFVTLFVAMFLPILVVDVWSRKADIFRLSRWRLIILGVLLLLGIGFLGANLRRSLPFKHIAKADISLVQDYAEPLGWINTKESDPIVVWADDDMSIYIPILTKHYVLWSHLGGLHLMPTQEVEDRYLVSRMKPLTADELFSSLESVEGAGVTRQYEDVFNKAGLQCAVHIVCLEAPTLRAWYGEGKLNELLKRQADLKKNMARLMKRFHVSYIIADTHKHEEMYLKTIPDAVQVWSNDQFIIYEIK